MTSRPVTISRRSLLAAAMAAAAGPVSAQRSTSYFAARVGFRALPSSMDPLTWKSSDDQWAGSLLADSPLRWSENGEILPGIAAVDDVSGDGRQWRLLLRPDAMIEKRPLNARDVYHSLQRAIDHSDIHGQQWRFDHVDQILVDADDQLTISMSRADVSIPATLASSCCAILPDGKEVVDSRGGSGPYLIGALTDSIINLVRNPLYWQIGRPRIPLVQLRAIPDHTERVTQVAVGGFELLPNISVLDAATLRSSDKARLIGGPSNALVILHVNVHRPFLNQRHVRQTLSRGLDRTNLVQTAIGGEGDPTAALFQESGWFQADIDTPESLTGEAVQQFWRDEGITTDIRLNLIADNDNSELANMAVVLQGQFASMGIALSLDLLEAESLTTRLNQGDFDLALATLPNWRDPHELVRPLLQSGGPQNASGYSSAAVDYLIQQAILTTRQAGRQQRYERIAEHVLKDVPIIPLARLNSYDVCSFRITGVEKLPPVTAHGYLPAHPAES